MEMITRFTTMMMENSVVLLKVEGALRAFFIGTSVLTALLVGFDKQTKLLFSSIERTATSKDLDALVFLMIVESAAAGYNLLQMLRGFLVFHFKERSSKTSTCFFNVKLAWICFLLDQIVAYISLGATVAAAQASLLSITGNSNFQWLKLCNTYTRFCVQIGGSLFCGIIASFLMALISTLSAFHLFRHYSRTKFLVLKPSFNKKTNLSIQPQDVNY